MKKGLFLFTILVIAAFVSTLRLPDRFYPLTEQRLREALSDDKILNRVGVGVAGTFTRPIPHSFHINPGLKPALYHRDIGISIDKKESKVGVSSFGEGPILIFPVDLARRKLRSLIETVLETKMLNIESREAKNFDPEVVRIRISYLRPELRQGWIKDFEQKILSVSHGDKRVQKFLDLFSREVLDFTELALEKFPSLKPRGGILTEKQAEEVEKELQKKYSKSSSTGTVSEPR